MEENKKLETIAGQFLKTYKRTNYLKVGLIATVVSIGLGLNFYNTMDIKTDHIAHVEITGTIGAESKQGHGVTIAKMLHKAMSDKKAKAIVIHASSPGGHPSASSEINELIKAYTRKPLSSENMAVLKEALTDIKYFEEDDYPTFEPKLDKLVVLDAESKESVNIARKPVIAIISQMCASACVQAVINADIILAQSSAIVGNIGVRLDTLNWQQLADFIGIKHTTIASSSFKDILNPWKKIDESHIDLAKASLVEPVFEQFKNDVREGRAGVMLNEEELFSGKTWIAPKAIQHGLVDAINTQLSVKNTVEKIYNVKYQDYNQKPVSIKQFLFSRFNLSDLN